MQCMPYINKKCEIMPNYRRAFVPGGSFFFTVVTYKRQYILTKPKSLEILRYVVNDVKREHPFTIDGWVLLPEHIHCICLFWSAVTVLLL